MKNLILFLLFSISLSTQKPNQHYDANTKLKLEVDTGLNIKTYNESQVGFHVKTTSIE